MSFLTQALARRLRRRWRGLLAAAVLTGGCVLLAAWLVPLPERLTAPHSPVLRYHDGSPAHVFVSEDGKWRVDAPRGTVDPAFVEALIRLEDKRFWWHPGVDPVAMARAMALNLRRGRVISGGSTLTMQLVRMLEPRPRRLASKIIEALRAAQLELRLGKRGVMQAYLTFAPYGRNVEGVEAAAWSYFGHGASRLSSSEIATLLAVPQAPARLYPRPDHELRLRVARDRLGARLAGWGILPRPHEGGSARDWLTRMAALPAPARLRAFPRHAPHAAYWLRDATAATGGMTTLDAGVQALAERLARAASFRARDQGISSHAVVVVDNATAEVKALVGGGDFWGGEHGSQIPTFAVPRSPGSALKPLIYAMAVDRGLALPDWLIEDAPRDFSGYSPKNYDGQYSGLVRLYDALAKSLNIPFVNLLERLGTEAFLGTLAQAGAARLTAVPGRYGLSAAIGGLEITPMELAGLYLALARDGDWRPLTVTPRAQAPKDMPILSAGAAFLTRRALRLRDRPDMPRRRDFFRLPASVFWKTGTSFGHRDAWTVGASSRYTAAVWFGNVDYQSSFALVGSELAAPLLFDLLEGLATPLDRYLSEAVPEDLMQVRVCSHSGRLPTAACPLTRLTLAPRRAVPTVECPYHARIEVDVDSGLAVTPACRNGRRTEWRDFMRWPTAVKRFLADGHRRLPEPPSLHPECRGEGTAPARLGIVSPRANYVALLIPGVDPERQEIPFEADTTANTGELSWFVNGAFLGRQPATARFWWTPRLGEHVITVADGQGRTASRQLVVRAP